MKRLICLIALMALVIGCGDSFYEAGYQDGTSGAPKSSQYSKSEKYTSGYDDGAEDTYYYDLGCQDKTDGKLIQYPSLEEYMEGYTECY